MSEVVKLLTCLIVVFVEEGRSFKRFKAAINNTIVRQPIDTLKICVPSFVYIVQNNLLYLSASHLDAATYQVSFFFAVSYQFNQSLLFLITSYLSLFFSCFDKGDIPIKNFDNSIFCCTDSTSETFANAMGCLGVSHFGCGACAVGEWW